MTTKKFLRQFGRRDKFLRAAFLLTQCYGVTHTQLATRLHRSRSMVTYYLQGRPMPPEVSFLLMRLLAEKVEEARAASMTDTPAADFLRALADLSDQTLSPQ